MSKVTDFVVMDDMELQRLCIEAGHQFVEHIYKDADQYTKTIVQNAVAAGFSKGYRHRQAEEELERTGRPQ